MPRPKKQSEINAERPIFGIGAVIRARRRELEMSQKVLAQAFGTSQERMSHLESGYTALHASDVPRLAEILAVTPAYFFDENVLRAVTERELAAANWAPSPKENAWPSLDDEDGQRAEGRSFEVIARQVLEIAMESGKDEALLLGFYEKLGPVRRRIVETICQQLAEEEHLGLMEPNDLASLLAQIEFRRVRLQRQPKK